PLTTDGTEAIRNASPDQTNGLIASGHWWSPDSTKLACLVTDQGKVEQFPMQDSTDEDAPYYFQRYAHPGTDLPVNGVRVLSAGRDVFLQTGAYTSGYLAQVRWLPDSRHLALQFLNRKQNELTLLLADSETGLVTPIFTE